MYPVTQEFQKKIKANIRKVYGKVQIDYTDPFLDQSIEVTASEKANVSYPHQTADGLSEPYAKIASLDGSWELDGTYSLAPIPEESETKQMGWWGKQLSGIGGSFIEPYPTLVMTFMPRPIVKLQVAGDSKRQEWPVDFKIRLYGSNDALLYTENVSGNTEIEWSKMLSKAITQVEKMELQITKWSHPYRQAKILEFFTSIQETYEGKDILSINLLEEREVGQGSLPVGNISSNEIDIRLNNESRKFDAGNTESPLYQLLKPNRRIRAWLGVTIERNFTWEDCKKSTWGEIKNKTWEMLAGKISEIEYIPLGTFWSGDWSAPEDRVYARTTGRDRLEFLHKTEYAHNAVRQNMSLYDLALDVMNDAGLNSDEYWIDEELKDYIIPVVALKPQSHREVLRKIAEACLGQVYCDRHGIIRVEGTKAIEEQNTVTASENANVSYPNQTVDDIDTPDGKYASLDGSWVLDGSFVLAPETEGPQMGWWGRQLAGADGSFVEPYPILTVSFHKRAIEAVKVVGDSARGEYPVDYTIKIYDATDNLLSTQEVIGNDQVTNTTPIPENPTNATKIELEIHKWSHPGRQVKILEFINTLQKLEITPEGYFRKDNPAQYKEVANYITVRTQPVDANGEELDGETIVAKDDKSITENGKLPFEFPDNPLVQTTEMAREIADRLLQLYKDPRRNLSLEWRGNPALLLGNIVTVTDNRERNDYKVVRQEIRYDGALGARLEGRRMLDVAKT